MLTIKIISFILLGYLGFYSFFWLLVTVLGIGYQTSMGRTVSKAPNILILLPAYKPGPIFRRVLEKVKTLEVLHPNIKVFCLMQHADEELVTLSQHYQFIVHQKTFDEVPCNSYHHALNYLVTQIETHPELKAFKPDFTMILDKDNLIDDDFLKNIPYAYFQRYQVIQGRREAISSQQSTSFFDKVSEAMNDCMFRATHSRLGFLPEVSGSAALIKTDIFCDAIRNLDPEAPGYDKNFMVQLLINQKITGIFIPESFISEEKTDNIDSFQPQRLRWFGEQYFNALFSAGKLLKSWVRGGWSSLFYLLILWRPPRSIQLFLVPSLGILEVILYAVTGQWMAGFPLMLFSTAAISLAVFLFLANQNLLKVAANFTVHLPYLIMSNFISAFTSVRSKNRGKFIHTEHKL